MDRICLFIYLLTYLFNLSQTSHYILSVAGAALLQETGKTGACIFAGGKQDVNIPTVLGGALCRVKISSNF